MLRKFGICGSHEGLFDVASRLLAFHGLELRIEDDLRIWAEHLTQASHTDGVNPAFDPRHSPVSSENSFWLSLRDANEDVRGCVAYRVFATGPFLDLLRTGRVWFDPVPPAYGDRFSFALPPDLPDFTGVVGHIGGLWAHPAQRGIGLTRVLMHLARAMALERFDIEWETSVMKREIADTPALYAAYRMQHTVPCVDGFFPPSGRHEQLLLNYSHRTHLVAGVHQTEAEVRDRCEAIEATRREAAS